MDYSMKKLSTLSVTAVAIVIGTFTGFTVSSALAGDATRDVSTQEVAKVTYKKNAQGQTFGSAMDAGSPADEPDLIFAIADDQTTFGYVKKADLKASHGTDPKNPEEAVRMMKERKNTPRVVKVYAEDGKTVVGTKTMQGGGSAEGAAAAMPGN
ncbi:hypothetical protein ACX80U_09840 [Arthrobacter sp. TmT3-37]